MIFFLLPKFTTIAYIMKGCLRISSFRLQSNLTKCTMCDDHLSIITKLGKKNIATHTNGPLQ